MRASKYFSNSLMLSISDAQRLIMTSKSDTDVFTRGALRRGLNAVLCTLAGVDAPQAPQLVRGACDPATASGSHCQGLYAGSSTMLVPAGKHDLSKALH